MIIKILVKAGGREKAIKKINEKEWEVITTKVAVNNEANLDIIGIIAKDLGIAKGRVNIIRGLKSKRKMVEIS